jgi:hypothetical protein
MWWYERGEGREGGLSQAGGRDEEMREIVR